MVDDAKVTDPANTSGRGRLDHLPEGVAGWSWGGFVFSWIWAIGNRTWPGLLGLVPGVGLVMRVLLGMKGRQWAWQNRRWDSVAQFRRVQRRWSIAAGVVALLVLIALIAAVATATLPAHQRAAPQAGEQLEL